jgi:hypothetical protein
MDGKERRWKRISALRCGSAYQTHFGMFVADAGVNVGAFVLWLKKKEKRKG